MPSAESRHLTDLLMRLTRILHEQMKLRVTKRPLSLMQLHTLIVIERSRPSMHDLAHRLTITPPSTTTLVNGLVQSSLVRRLKDPRDKRTLHLELTPQGKKLLRDRLRMLAEGMQEATGALRADELRTFIALMERMVSSYT